MQWFMLQPRLRQQHSLPSYISFLTVNLKRTKSQSECNSFAKGKDITVSNKSSKQLWSGIYFPKVALYSRHGKGSKRTSLEYYKHSRILHPQIMIFNS